MLAASSLGYIDSGEFTFFDVDLFYFPGDYWGDHDWYRGDSLDHQAMLAYTALFHIALPDLTHHRDFTEVSHTTYWTFHVCRNPCHVKIAHFPMRCIFRA